MAAESSDPLIEYVPLSVASPPTEIVPALSHVELLFVFKSLPIDILPVEEFVKSPPEESISSPGMSITPSLINSSSKVISTSNRKKPLE